MKRILYCLVKFFLHPIPNLLIGVSGLILMGIYADYSVGLESIDPVSAIFGAFFVIFLSIFHYGLYLTEKPKHDEVTKDASTSC